MKKHTNERIQAIIDSRAKQIKESTAKAIKEAKAKPKPEPTEKDLVFEATLKEAKKRKEKGATKKDAPPVDLPKNEPVDLSKQ